MCPYWLRRTGSDSPSRIGQRVGDRRGLSLDGRQVVALDRSPHHVLDERPRPAAASRTPSAPCFATKSAGSSPCGMIITTACTGIRLLERERPLGGPRAGLVGVEREDRSLREPAQQPEVRLPQRRAARGDGVLDAGLHEPDHVGVSLDHEDLADCARSTVRAPARLNSTSFFL